MAAAAAAFLFMILTMALVAPSSAADTGDEITICAPEIFVFADSLSDTGNLCTAAPSLCLAGVPPYGQNFPTKQPTGRFSNGKNIMDFVAEHFGLPQLIDPYLLTVGANFTSGMNFGNAGSTATFAGALVVPARGRNSFILNAQIGEYRRMQKIVTGVYKTSSSHVDFHRLPAPESFSRALYYVEIGGNDVNYNNLVLGASEEQIITSVLPAVVKSIRKGINRLIHYGARNFLVFNFPRMGCASIMLALGRSRNFTSDDYDEFGCLKTFNRMADAFNRDLKAEIEKLRIHYAPKHCRFVLADYSAVHLGMLNGTLGNFSMTTRLDACCGRHDMPYNCPSPPHPIFGCFCSYQFPFSSVCSDPDDYLIWDGIHFTEKFSQVAVDAFFQPNSKYIDTGADNIRISRTCSGSNSTRL